MEVGWWKLHDELEGISDKSKLASAFTSLYSEVFNVGKEKLLEAGQYKVKATYEHDLAEDHNTNKRNINKHWKNAEKLLVKFYEELKKAVEE